MSGRILPGTTAVLDEELQGVAVGRVGLPFMHWRVVRSDGPAAPSDAAMRRASRGRL
jgi:hypothetical protein